MKKLLLAMLLLIIGAQAFAQNATITDDLNHEPDNSAILDLKSDTKGFLMPRLTTAMREAIINPAYGLMVFDTDLNSFFFYGVDGWIDVSTNNDPWGEGINVVYIKNPDANTGFGTENPTAYVHIKQQATKDSISLFKVEKSSGEKVFNVSPNGVDVEIPKNEGAILAVLQ